MKKIIVLHGPNLDRLGSREPDYYGKMTLSQINNLLKQNAAQHNVIVDIYQTNSESKLIELIYKAHDEQYNAIIVNAAAYSHTSIALRDALLTVKLPFIEVHISNIYKREAFRHQSFLSDIALGCVIGLGGKGYNLALEAIIDYLK